MQPQSFPYRQRKSSCSLRMMSLMLFVLVLLSDISPQSRQSSIFVSGMEKGMEMSEEGSSRLEDGAETNDNFGPTQIVVSEEGATKVTIEYMLLTTESVVNANRESMLSPVALASGGMFTVRMVYEELGWVAFGLSPSGTMVGGEVVIGEPSATTNLTQPYKYRMEGLSREGIIQLPNEQQTLMDARVTQNVEEGTTTLEFSKLLSEAEELAIVPGQEHTFIWAVGYANELGYHAARNSFTVPELLPGDVEAAPIVLGDATVPNQTIWMLHGMFAIFAWGICAPVAVASALLKAYLPDKPVGLWYKMHYYGNLTCIASTIIAVALAVYATEAKKVPHFVGKHPLIGLLVFVIVAVQLLNGYFRPPAHKPPPPTQPEDNDNDLPEKEQDPEKTISENDSDAHPQMPTTHDPYKKPLKRTLFEIGHRIIGVTLLSLGMINIHTGLGLYAAYYMTSTTEGVWTITAFWGYMGTFIAMVVLLKCRVVIKNP